MRRIRAEMMRILFDHGTPAPLRHAFTGHAVATAYEMGWTAPDNGALLEAAEKQFDAFITTDQNLSYQQNLSRLRLAILVLPTTSWPRIRDHQARGIAAVNALRPGDIVKLSF